MPSTTVAKKPKMAGESGLGARVRRLRQNLKMSQQQLAELVGVSQSAIAQIEAGKIPSPRWHLMLALAKALGLTLDELASPPEESESST
jgi:transcriptional regulator with XRE-family HTH domain